MEWKVEDQEQRKAILSSTKKAGYLKFNQKSKTQSRIEIEENVESVAAPSTSSSSPQNARSSPQKRKRDDDLNEPLPDSSDMETEKHADFDFNEVLDEKVAVNTAAELLALTCCF